MVDSSLFPLMKSMRLRSRQDRHSCLGQDIHCMQWTTILGRLGHLQDMIRRYEASECLGMSTSPAAPFTNTQGRLLSA